MGDAYNSMVDWYKRNNGAARVEYEGVQELHGETPVKTRKFLPPETPPEEPAARYQPKEPAAPQLLPPFDSLLELLGAYVTDPPGSLDYIEQLPEVRAKSLPELVCWAADERRTQLLHDA